MLRKGHSKIYSVSYFFSGISLQILLNHSFFIYFLIKMTNSKRESKENEWKHQTACPWMEKLRLIRKIMINKSLNCSYIFILRISKIQRIRFFQVFFLKIIFENQKNCFRNIETLQNCKLVNNKQIHTHGIFTRGNTRRIASSHELAIFTYWNPLRFIKFKIIRIRNTRVMDF